MRLTSFQRALVIVGGGAAVIGGGVALGIATHRRHAAQDDAARATPISVDDLTDAVLHAYDWSAFADPLAPTPDTTRGPDGRLAVGWEDHLPDGVQLYPELVGELDPYSGKVVSGRAFITAADADHDAIVTRAELRAAIDARAGADHLLDEGERRRLLLDDGLARIEDHVNITGWQEYGNHVATAGRVAELTMQELQARAYGYGSRPDDRHSLPIADIAAEFPWQRGATTDDRRLGEGPITSYAPLLGKIDDAGNHDGTVTEREIAEWVAKERADPELPFGHVRYVHGASLMQDIDPTVLGRIDRTAVHGRAFYDPRVPDADVQRWFGGDLAAFLDAQKGVHAALGGTAWERDPHADLPSSTGS